MDYRDLFKGAMLRRHGCSAVVLLGMLLLLFFAGSFYGKTARVAAQRAAVRVRQVAQRTKCPSCQALVAELDALDWSKTGKEAVQFYAPFLKEATTTLEDGRIDEEEAEQLIQLVRSIRSR